MAAAEAVEGSRVQDGSRDTLLWRVLPLAGCVTQVKRFNFSEPLHP